MDNKPTYLVYHVADRDQDTNGESKSFWTKIGAAWPHKDAKGFNLFVEMLPLDGRLVLREREEKEEQTTPAEKQEALPLPAE